MKKEIFTVAFLLPLAMFLVVAPFLSYPALGQKYPAKPIEILVPWAGGTQEIVSRLIANIAPKYLGQPLVVVLKPGAAGSVAAAEIINSKPDGYKLYSNTNIFFALAAKTQKIPFNPNHITPLVNFIEFKQGFAVKGDSPWKTFDQLLDFAKKNPGKLKWAHSGRGLTQHLAMSLIFKKAGIETVDIPYRAGFAETVVALLGGHIHACSLMYPPAKDHAKAGKLRFLVFFTDRRYADSPDVPTVVEIGFPEVAKFNTYWGYFIHKDTPEEIKRTLTDAFKKTFEEPEFRKVCEDLAEEPKFEGPEFLKQKIKDTEEIGVPLLKELGLYVDR